MTDVRILTEALGGSPFSRFIQRGASPAAWLSAPPLSADAWRQWASSRAAAANWSDRLAALAPAFAATGAAADRLERVQREGGVVVTTGQQPGLFGGPVYTWSKAIGALAFADALERDTGIATAAVFWAATDDADFAEASYTVLGLPGGAEVLRSTYAPPAGTPMSVTPLGDLSAELTRLEQAAGSAADPRPLRIVREAYGDASCTVGEAYVALLREVLAPLGIPVLDASHAAVRTASEPTLRAALEGARDIEAALAGRSREIRAAGFEPQVEDVAGLSLVFIREGTVKRRLGIAEVPEVASDAVLTPNVLLRAIVERDILPTVAYIGGPGELAYFAQVSAVASAMGAPAPMALPRWSCTLIEPHVGQLLARFGIEPTALSQPDALEGVVARMAMSPASTDAFANVRRSIAGLPGALAPESDPLGLGAAVQGAMQSLQHRVDRLERRLVARIKRRETQLLRDVATLRAALYPRGTRQERALNLLPTLSRHGLGVLDDMRVAAAGHAADLIQPASPVSAESETSPLSAR